MYLRKLSAMSGVEVIARECAELHLRGVAPGAPESLDLQRRHAALWIAYYGTDEGSGEASNSWRAMPDTLAMVVSSGWRPR